MKRLRASGLKNEGPRLGLVAQADVEAGRGAFTPIKFDTREAH